VIQIVITEIKGILLRGNATVRQAMRALDDSGLTVLLLIDDEGRLVRTVTDGDLRRLLMSGGTLESALEKLPEKAPITINDTEDGVAALTVMNRLIIDQLPVVGPDRRPVGLFLRREVDGQVLLSTPHMGVEEIAFIESAFRTNWIAPLGPNVDAFERELAHQVGIGHAAAVSSGTAAIHLALRLLGVNQGDRVFCSSLTFVATANPILYERAIPVFIDSEPESWNMSPAALSRAFAESARAGVLPKAVIVVNLYGQSADFDPILEICRSYEVPLIEDAAESLGATYKGHASGTFGLMGVYSFNGNKIITTSGGGMIVSEDRTLIEKARFLSTQARDIAPHYEHSQIGFNYRMSNILAGIGRGQLKVLGQRVAARQSIFERYRVGLESTPAVGWMPEVPYGRSTRWLSACVIDSTLCGVTPAELINRLNHERIEARHIWKPLHLQPLFTNCAYFPHQVNYSVSDDLFARGICLPSGSNLAPEQQDRVIRALRTALGTPVAA